MFDCKDSNDKQVHTNDLARLISTTPDGLPKDSEGTVVAILSSEQVNFIPEVGLPEIIAPNLLVITYSFITRIEQLETCEELQEILKLAEGKVVTKKKAGGLTVEL